MTPRKPIGIPYTTDGKNEKRNGHAKPKVSQFAKVVALE
jgi:hypothetical protein